MAEATRRGFLLTFSALMESEKLELSEVETFGKYLRDYARGVTPKDVRDADSVPAETNVSSSEERTRQSRARDAQ